MREPVHGCSCRLCGSRSFGIGGARGSRGGVAAGA